MGKLWGNVYNEFWALQSLAENVYSDFSGSKNVDNMIDDRLTDFHSTALI